MLLYSLSHDPSKPCFVLRFKSIVLMLDCGISLQTLLDFLPISLFPRKIKYCFEAWNSKESNLNLNGEIKLWRGKAFVNSIPEFCPPLMDLIDFSEIDVILVSNYSLILGLPFITENTGFKGLVYATEPTLQIGRLLLQELVDFLGDPPSKKHAKLWKDVVGVLPSPLDVAFKPKSWRKLFSSAQLEASLSKVKVVGYDELLDLYGAIQVKAVCSGYRLGSCNWIITTDFEKIVYISTSSTLTTHRKPMDSSALKDANALIMAGLRQNVTSNPENALSTLCSIIGETVRGGGNALLPCYPSGVIYDLFECVSIHLDSLGLTSVPIFFISPVADISLAYSNILGEWLSQAKQNKVYLPEEPFPHAFLVKTGRLKYFKRIYSEGFSAEFKQPCIIFCGHPSLRFGDVVHFIGEWASNSLHSLILTEPDVDFTRALEPFQPLSMKVFHCPIDVGLNFHQANRLLKDLHPTSIAVPHQYTQLPAEHLSRKDLTINQDLGFVQSIGCGEALRIPVKRRYVKAMLSPILATRTTFTPVKSGIAFASFTGNLVVKDNNYLLECLEAKEYNEIPPRAFTQYEFGQVDIDKFLDKARMIGLPKPFVQINCVGEYIIHFFGEKFWLHIQKNQTQVMCSSKEEHARRKIRAFGEKFWLHIQKNQTQVMCSSKEEHARRKIRAVLMDCLNLF